MQETPEAGMGKERDSPQRLQNAALPPPQSEPKEALTLQNGDRIQLGCLSPYIYGKLLEQQEVANLTTDGRAFRCLGMVARAGAAGRGPLRQKPRRQEVHGG